MNAYEKIYEALTQGKDGAWKKRVDETLSGFKKQGMTDLQAMKHTAMELNVEKESLDLSGIFLKAYTTRAGKSLFNIVVDGETIPVEGDVQMAFPTYPTAISIKNANKVHNLMTKKTWIEIDDKSVVALGAPANPEELLAQTKVLIDVPDGEYCLLAGRIMLLKVWKEPIVTPEQANLKLDFRSGDLRTGCFVTDFEFLMCIMPSAADQEKFKTHIDTSDWEGALDFFNEICAENRDFGIDGVEVLVYGKVTDNNYISKKTQEEVVGKNVRVSVGGFIYSVDLLSEKLSNPVPAAKKEAAAFSPNLFKFDAEVPEEPPAAPIPAVEVEIKVTAPEVEAPDVESIEDSIMHTLNSAKNGLLPQELLAEIKVSAEELSAKLSALHKAGKVQLKDGKFYAKRKK